MGRKITVYSYWTWVPGQGLGHIAPTKRPQAEIEASGGLAILVTGEEIDEDDLPPIDAAGPSSAGCATPSLCRQV